LTKAQRGSGRTDVGQKDARHPGGAQSQYGLRWPTRMSHPGSVESDMAALTAAPEFVTLSVSGRDAGSSRRIDRLSKEVNAP